MLNARTVDRARGAAALRITVVTPAYNAAATIADCIASVLAQTHDALRMIVVDDGSTDDTVAVVARLGDDRLTLLHQPNAGVAAARNQGIAAAEGDALLFLDADDRLAPGALATLSAALVAAPAAVAAVGGYARVAASGGIVERRAYPAASRDLLPRLLVQNQFANGGHVLIRHAAVSAAGGFRRGIAYGEDWEFFIRIALLGPFAFVPGAAPVLFAYSRPDGAYRRLAAEPGAFGPCMAAIFGNPSLMRRFGAARLASLRSRTEAENAWIVGRELIRHGHAAEGRRWLSWSVIAAPSPRRLALLAAAHVLPVLPQRWRGPFRRYAGAQPCGAGVGNGEVATSCVPGPGSLGLAATGLVAPLGLMRRRRR